MSANSFDTFETFSYKLAKEWKIPHSFITIVPNERYNPEYMNVIDFVERSIENKLPLDSIKQYLNKISDSDWFERVASLRILMAVQLLFRDEYDEEYTGILSNLKENKKFLNLSDVSKQSKMQAVMKEINDYRQLNKEIPMDLGMMKKSYLNILRDLNKDKNEDKESYESILEDQEIYNEAMKRKVFKISSMNVILEELLIYVNNEVITQEDTFSLFDLMIANRNVQHIMCKYNGLVFHKQLSPGPFDEPIRDKAIISKDTVIDDGVIMFTIALRSVYTVKYVVGEGIMEFSCKSIDKNAIFVIIKKLFVGLSLEMKTNSLQCQIRLYPTKENSFLLKEYYILHRVVTQPRLFQFYLNESTTPYPKKSRLRFRYRPYWRTPTGYIKDESIFVLSLLNTVNNTNYISVDIESKSLSSVYRLMTSLIPSLSIYYYEDIINKSPLFNIYNIPGLDLKVSGVQAKVKKILRDQWPDVFTQLYVKSVQVKDLVKITTDVDEAMSWKEDKIRYNEIEYPRMVLPFPPDSVDEDVMFWFTSISKEMPYVGYRNNKYDDNPKYPLVPGSFSSMPNQMKKLNKGKGTAISNMALKTERYGLMSESVEVVVGKEIKRLGHKIDPNSLIRSVLIALGKDSLDEDVLEVRRSMHNLRPELYKQELYDLTYEEISERLSNYSSFLDPSVYKAGLEYLYDIDIYVITSSTTFNITTHVIDIPRHNHFYCRSSNVRECVIIFKNKGLKSDTLEYPHCELIVPKEGSYLFSKRISRRMLNGMENSLVTLTRTEDGKMYNKKYTRSNVHRIMKNAVSQYIDGKGKSRALTFEYNNDYITIFLSPFAPLNLPHTDKIHSVKLEEALLFCESDKISYKDDKGVWVYNSKLKENVYVPITDLNSQLLDGIAQSEFKMYLNYISDEQVVENMSRNDKIVLVLNELIKWLFEVDSLTIDNNDIESFMDRWIRHTNENEKDYYTIDNAIQLLPAVNSAEDCFKYIKNIIPVDEETGKYLVFHSKIFKDSMRYMISRHSKEMKLSRSTKEVRRIANYYQSLSDFRKVDKNVVFSKGVHITDINKQYQVRNFLSQEYESETDAIIYDKYIVQNTRLGDYKSAHIVCHIWDKELKNVGYGYKSSTIEDTMDNSIVIYRISQGSLEPVYDTGNDDDTSFYEILLYESGTYAALLRF